MKFYLYDKKTKQYVKEQEGFLDPLETKAQGKDVYLVPPFFYYRKAQSHKLER